MKFKALATFFILCGISAFSNAVAAEPSLLPSTNSKDPIEINADSLEVLQKDKKAIFTGKVEAKQGKMNVKADKMTVYYSDGGSDSNSISRIDLDGNVLLTSPAESARAAHGVYDTTNSFVTLTGDVTLTKDQNILKGSKLEYDIKAGRSKLDNSGTSGQGGRVRGLFTPESN